MCLLATGSVVLFKLEGIQCTTHTTLIYIGLHNIDCAITGALHLHPAYFYAYGFSISLSSTQGGFDALPNILFIPNNVLGYYLV